MFFMGTYTPKLDDKGRLFLPAKFRDQLAEGLVVTRGQERCLTVWPMADFVELTRRAQEAPVTVKGARDYARILFAGAVGGDARQAGPDHDPADAARVRLAQPRRRGHRRDEPDRDLGPGALAAVLRGAGGRSSPSSATRSSPGSDPDPAPPSTTTHHTTAQRIRRTRSRARSLASPSGAPSPVPDGHFPPRERAGTWSCGSPAARSQPSAAPASTTAAHRAGSRP